MHTRRAEADAERAQRAFDTRWDEEVAISVGDHFVDMGPVFGTLRLVGSKGAEPLFHDTQSTENLRFG